MDEHADYIDDHPLAGRMAAVTLLRCLLRAGLSRYEPDPLVALETIEARDAAPSPV